MWHPHNRSLIAHGVVLGAVGLIAALFGLLVARGLAGAYLPSGRLPAGRISAPPPLRPPRGPVVAPGDGAAVVDRNAFCSACAAPGRRRLPPRPPTCELPAVELLATLLVPKQPVRSWAVVRLQDPVRVVLARPGTRLGSARVERVTPRGVRIALCGGEHLLGWSPMAAGAARSPRARETTRIPVRRLGRHSYSVERRWVQETLGRLGPAMAQGAARPVVRGGQMVGVRLVRLPRGAAFRQLGLQPGDVVTAINGRRLDSPDALLWVLTTLPAARHVTVAVERRRAAVTLAYRIE